LETQLDDSVVGASRARTCSLTQVNMGNHQIISLVPSDIAAGELDAELAIEEGTDFSSMDLALEENYYDGFAKANASSTGVRAADYLHATDGDAYRGLMCVETPIPKALASRIELRVRDSSDLAGKEAIGLFHAGRSGSIAPLHFDWDHRWIFHACLTGRKTIYLIPPDAGWLLNPVINTSAICVPRLSVTDRGELLHRLGGTEIALFAGQGVLFPSLWWHAVLYEAPSMSVSVRFGEQPRLRPFAVLPRSFWLQRLVWWLFRHPAAPDAEKCLVQCLEAFLRPGIGWKKRYQQVNGVYRRLLLERNQSFGAMYLTSDNFNSEIYLARQELKEAYSLPSSGSAVEMPPAAVEEVEDYLFEALRSGLSGPEKSDPIPSNQRRNLAEYALASRQGLRPRRGLVAMQLLR